MRSISTIFFSWVIALIITISCTNDKTQLMHLKLCKTLNEESCEFDSSSFRTSIPLIYCSFNIKNPKFATALKISWYYISDSRVLIEETSLIIPESKSSTTMHSSLNRPLNGWPKGVYEVELSLESKKPITMVKSFSINK
jgi:hypothetical protein